jgi:hypothetical protein
MTTHIKIEALNYFNSLPLRDQIELKKDSIKNNLSLLDYILLLFHYEILDNI